MKKFLQERVMELLMAAHMATTCERQDRVQCP